MRQAEAWPGLGGRQVDRLARYHQEFAGEHIVVHLVQRIIVNSYGWTRPSPGRLGPLGEGKYVRENGFGHEDWNFNLDLAIDGHIYGYAYYEPSNAKAGDQFQMAFVTYTGHRWHLSGFYFNAEFVNTAPTSKAILNAKVKDLLALGSTNSLGKSWIRLKEERMRQKLEEKHNGCVGRSILTM